MLKIDESMIDSVESYRQLTLEAADEYNRKNYESALEKFLRLCEVNYKNPKIHEVLVYIYLNLENVNKASEEYDICIRLMQESDPNFKAPIQKNFDELVSEAGNRDELEKQAREVMETTDGEKIIGQIETISKLSVIYMSQGEYAKAEELLCRYKEKLEKYYQQQMSLNQN